MNTMVLTCTVTKHILQWVQFNPNWNSLDSKWKQLLSCRTSLYFPVVHFLSQCYHIAHITKSLSDHYFDHKKGFDVLIDQQKLYLSCSIPCSWIHSVQTQIFCIVEDFEEMWKLLTAAFINNLSEHKTHRKDTTEIESLRQC